MKRTRKNLITLLLCLSLGASAFALAGCENDDTNTPPPQTPPVTNENTDGDKTTDNPDDTPSPTPTPDPVTLDEFLSDYEDEAKTFVSGLVGELTEDKELLSENWAFEANADDELTSVSVKYTYAGENHERVEAIATITFESPILIQDIIDEEIDKTDLAGSISHREVFSYDAKQNYLKEDLKAALAEAAGITSDNFVFKEVETDDEDIVKYEIAVTDENNNTDIYTIETEKAASEEELIANLADEEKTTATQSGVVSFGSSDNQITNSEYTLETFLPESVDDLLENYSEYVHTALNNNFLDKIGKACYGRNAFDATKIIEADWKLITDENDETSITCVKFVSTYNYSTTSNTIDVGTIDLAEPINITDFVSEDASTIFAIAASNASFNSNYSLLYKIAEQGTRDDLMNAIFEAKDMGKEAPEGAIRYFSDIGATTDSALGEVRQFKVYQVENDKITEFAMIIKLCSSDEAYIDKLQDSTNYAIESEKNAEFPGKTFEYKVLEVETENEQDFELDL